MLQKLEEEHPDWFWELDKEGNPTKPKLKYGPVEGFGQGHHAVIIWPADGDMWRDGVVIDGWYLQEMAFYRASGLFGWRSTMGFNADRDREWAWDWDKGRPIRPKNWKPPKPPRQGRGRLRESSPNNPYFAPLPSITSKSLSDLTLV